MSQDERLRKIEEQLTRLVSHLESERNARVEFRSNMQAIKTFVDTHPVDENAHGLKLYKTAALAIAIASLLGGGGVGVAKLLKALEVLR